MKPIQLYKYATWGLLIINLVLVFFLILGRPPGPPRGSGGKPPVTIKALGLDDDQDRLFLASVQEHEAQLDAINEQQGKALLPYFQSILEETDTTDYSLILDRVQELERAKIESLHEHFQDIKALLKPEQETAFEAFLEGVVGRMLIKGPPKH